MTTFRKRRLVLISGPLASGKTTAAFNLAAEARRRGLTAAAVDIDEVVAMVGGTNWSMIRDEDRARATELAAAIVQRLFESGTQLIAVAGSTVSAYEGDGLIARLDEGIDPLFVLLRVSDEEAKRRAKDDPARARSEPEFIATMAAQIDWSKVREHHIVLSTDGLSAQAVANLIVGEALP